jgi:hypothetical protein
LGQGADERVAASRHLTGESTQLIAQLGDDDTLEIDAIGISLKQLLVDHEATFTNRRLVRARLILLDPSSAMFNISVRQEGRDAAVMRAQLEYVYSAVSRILKERKDAGWDAGVEVRLLDGIMTVTGMRLAETWFFRPRFANESNNFQFFFERYDSTAPECFKMVSTQFTTLWEMARPVRIGVSSARKLTRGRNG